MLNNVTQKTIDAIYPVGALYLSMNNTNPENLFGGTWKQLTADAYLKIVTSEASDTAKGSTTHKIAVTNMPAHTHTRGTMNITGTFGNDVRIAGATLTGAFYSDNTRSNSYTGYAKDSANIYAAKFDASRNWTGATSSAGEGTAYYPGYIGVYVWYRTA